ncbi:hypothetical protein [Kribbella sp. CA-294648]|uniref:hypothetical protein n=1 Tax=Kribbella sp. CA-294648 TaxID=3239948 RepID=UPI003D93BF65
MDTYRPASGHDLQHAEVRRSSRGFLVFLAWIGAELVIYAALVFAASDETRPNCSGLCFSDRELLILLGMMFGLAALVGQLIVGLLLTRVYHRRRMTPFAAGRTAFFITFALTALVLGLLAVTQL